MRSCPNVKSPAWKNLVGALNEDIAWKTFIKTDGEIVTPQEAMMLTMTQERPDVAANLLNDYLPSNYKKGITANTRVIDLIRSATEGVYNNDVFKGYVISKGFAKAFNLVIPTKRISEDRIEDIFDANYDIAATAYAGLKKTRPKGVEAYRTKDYPLYQKLDSFLKKLNFEIKNVEDLQSWTGYNSLSSTDLLYKTILIANSESPTELLLNETAYVAYSFLGKKNKIRTDLVHSIENIDNYEAIFAEYKKRAPNLYDYKIKELIVIDFIADAIKNEFNYPSDSYINRKADYWTIKGNTKLAKKFNYYLSVIKRLINKILGKGKLDKVELNALLKDIAHDILVNNFQKYGSELSPDLQLTNYEKTIASDPKAKGIIENIQKLGGLLSGSLSLRRLGTLYRGSGEDLHDLDFSVYNTKVMEELEKIIEIDLDPSFFYMSDEQKEAYLQIEENRAYDRAFKDLNNLSIIKEIKKIYPQFKLVTSFPGLKPGERVLTGKIDDYVIDLFFVNDNTLDAQEKGFQDWESIFIAKIRMGRAKDMRDFANYVPFNTNKEFIARTKGFRHFSFIKNNLRTKKVENVFDVQARSLYADYRKTSFVEPGSNEDLMAFRKYLKLDDQLQNKKPSEYVREDMNKHVYDAMHDENFNYTVPKEFYDIQNKQRALEIAYKWADKLSAATGIANERISANVAEEMLAKTSTPYNGEPAFFFNGKVYLVEDNISLNNVFHEFAHPVVRMIAETNPELFTNLYTQLQVTREGQAIIDLVKAKYPKLKEGTPRFMEEVIVTAMGNLAEIKANEDKVNNQAEPASTGFKKVMKEILFNIKQFFRKIFQTKNEKVKIEKLSVDTTLDELAEMLTTKEFVIEQSKVTEEDIAMFAKINKEEIEAMAKAIDNDPKRKSFQFVINEFFDKVRKSSKLVSRVEFKGIKEELVSESGGGLLNKLARQLDGYSTRTADLDEKRQKLNELRDVQTQLQAMVNSVSTLKVVVERLDKAVKQIDEAKSPDYKSDLNTISFYKQLLVSWNEFIDEGLKNLEEAGLESNSPLVQEMTTVRESIRRANDHIYNIQKRSSADMLYDTLLFMRDNMNREHLRRMESLKKKLDEETSQDKKDLILKTMQEEDAEFKKYDITKEQIQAILSGEADDLGWWEKELLGILNIDDPVVGAFGLFIKDINQQAMRKAEELNVEFIRDIRPNLEALGYNPSNPQKFWEEYLFEDTTYEYDENGVLVPKKVITFLNPLKDFRFPIRKMYSDFQYIKDTGTKEEIALKAKEIRNHERKYYHQKYTSEFYKADEIFDEPYGDEAWVEREMVLDRIRRESGRSMTEFEEYMDHDANTIMWREYNQLYSLSYPDGTPKKGDNLAKAQLLRRHRDATKKFYEWVPIKDGFQTALENFVAQLQVSGISEDEIKEMVYGDKGWIKKNTKTVYTQEWYDKRIDVIDRIRDLTTSLRNRLNSPSYKKQLEDAGIDIKDIEALDVSEQYTYIIDLVTGFRNEDGQPQASDMGEKRLEQMFKLQKQIIDAQEKLSLFTGLSVDEMEIFVSLRNKIDEGKDLTPTEDATFESLIKKKGALPITGLELASLKGLYAELNNIQFKEPTDNYLEVMNVFMKVTGGPALDKTNADDLLDIDAITPLLNKDKDFKEWFLKNHIKKEYYNTYEEKKVIKYERLYAWSVVRPTLDKYIKKFTVKDPITNTEIPILGEPTKKFSFRRVKNEYRTIPIGLTPEQRQAYVGVIIDNMGNFLPKSNISEVKNPLTGKMTVVETAPDNTYINEQYENLKADPEKFELLEKMRKWHLKFQFGLTRDSKLYMDIPRFRQENLEAMQTGRYVAKRKERFKKVAGGAMAWATRKGRDVANAVSKEADDYQEGLANAELKEQEEVPLLRFMQFNIEDEGGSDLLPIFGLADVPLEDTSKDVLQSMSRYMFSAQKQIALNNVNPMIKGLKDVINDPRSMPKDLSKASITHKEERNIIRFKDKAGDKNKRRDLINYMYNREFKGQIYGDEEHLQWFNKFTSILMKGASFSFFALNIPSAVKNYWGFLWQQTLEGIAGHAFEKQVDDFLAPTAYNPYSMGEGKVWAKYAMMQWTSNLYGVDKAADVPLNLQIIRAFDAIQGKREERYTSSVGTEASRSFWKDLASFTVFFSPRRFMEVEAGLQLFGSMMHHQQIEIVENGQKRLINYIDAWEVDANNKMKLKDGIDKGWDIGGDKFKAFVNRVHETSNQLAGAFAKHDKPAAQRNFAYRLWAFMRSWMIPMFMARWSFKRYNFGIANTYEGWYITFGKTLYKLFTTFGKYAMLMSPKERAAIFKVLTDSALLFICWFVKAVLFDFDDDDEDRFKKIRAWRDDEPVSSWFGTHILKLTMGTANENSAFIPWFNYGLDDYTNATNISSIALGPTIKSYATILQDIFYGASGNKRARYKREVGPYAWQEKGDLKLWNHTAKIFGFTGGDWEPAVGLQSFSTTENKLK